MLAEAVEPHIGVAVIGRALMKAMLL